MNQLKIILYNIYLFYFLHTPIKKGRSKLGIFLVQKFGRAIYTIKGSKLKLHPLSLMDQKLILGKTHDQLVSQYIQKVFENGTEGVFVDVGANIGVFSIEASKFENVQVFAFEPSERELSVLYENIRLNRSTNIVVFPNGLSDKDEILELNISLEHNTGMNSFVDLKDYNIYDKKSRIRTLRFDGLFSQEVISKIRLMKIDVEGFEMNVLKGMAGTLSQVKNCSLVIEISRNYLSMQGDKPEDIYALLERNGFTPVFGFVDAYQYDEVFIKN